MAEIWPNLLPHKTFRADASLRQRLDSGHFLLVRPAGRTFLGEKVLLSPGGGRPSSKEGGMNLKDAERITLA